MKVWILEACYSYEGCQIAIKENGQHKYADDFPVGAYEVKGKKKK